MADTVSGGPGPDILTGGPGADIFDFDSTADIGNTVATRDVITDFEQGVDLIDFDDIDAHTGQAGMQRFAWLGTHIHSGEGATLRYQHVGGNTLIFGDTDGDGKGDFTLELTGIHHLTAADFTDVIPVIYQWRMYGGLFEGTSASERMIGSSSTDTIRGGLGADTIWSGDGNDVLDFDSVAEIGLAYGARDVILDFDIQRDKIDLDDIDALASAAGIQHFTWLGTEAHNGTGATLRYEFVDGSTLVTGDVDSDGIADFTLELTGLINLTARNFTNATIAVIEGTDGADLLIGGGGGNEVRGLAGADTVVSAYGVDIMTGGADADHFRWYNNMDYSGLHTSYYIHEHTGTGISNRDIVTDFQQGVDKIDLSPVDANTNLGGKQDFKFLGTAFHDRTGGTLRYTQTATTTVIWGDVNGDGNADFSIGLIGVFDLTADDFLGVVTGTPPGGDGNETIVGGPGPDTIYGGLGADRLTGGGGADIFDFDSAAEIGNSANTRDVITDFQQKADLIDFDDIDAHTGVAGLQHFTWLGTGDHSGGATLRYQHVGGNTLIFGDIDGDGRGDFSLHLNGIINLTANDFTPLTIAAIAGSGTVQGTGRSEILRGSWTNDTIHGGAGADTMFGGSGNDVFRFVSIADIGLAPGDRDVIADFTTGDRIDLDAIDALTTVAGLQHFDWLGTGAHSGTGATLRYEHVGGNTLVTGDVDADGVADFALEVTGTREFVPGDFAPATIARIVGTNGGDVLFGIGQGRAVLGLDGDDSLNGALGVDIMTGGAGADLFRWTSSATGMVNQTGLTVATRDIITDFQQGVDKIDLSGVDAKSGVAGNQDFVFVGAAFHTGAGGTLRYTQTATTTVIWGDVDGDGNGDFSIGLDGVFDLTVDDFIGVVTITPPGGDGNETIVGGPGPDTIYGGLGADTLTGGGGADIFDFDSVAEIGNSPSTRDVITDFQQGLDRIDFEDIDALITTAGHQHFTWLGTLGHIGTGATLRYQHVGGNTMVYGDVDGDSAGDFSLQLNGIHHLTADDFTTSTISAISGSNVTDDNLFGTSRSETLYGRNGNDTLNGSLGADTMVGGPGRDIYRFASVAEIGLNPGDRDVIADFATPFDRIDLDAIDALTTVAGVQHFTWLRTAAHSGAGATLRYEVSGKTTLVSGDVDADGVADFVLELTWSMTLDARHFTDATIARTEGTAGNDVIEGIGNGREVAGLAGADTIVSAFGADVMTGGDGADVFCWRASSPAEMAARTGTTAASRDVITDFQQGIDKIDLSSLDANSAIAERQAFAFLGTAFHDRTGGTLRYTHTATSTLVWGDMNADGKGDFSIELAGIYTLTADDFIGVVAGTPGAGNDTIVGGPGPDTIYGGLGADRLTGGGGADVFDFDSAEEIGNSAATRDVITDFEQGVDKIDFEDIDAMPMTAGHQNFTWLGTLNHFGTGGTLRYQHISGNTLILANLDGISGDEFSLQLNGIYHLTAADFTDGTIAVISGSNPTYDNLFGTDGVDTMRGLNGADTLNGSLGADTMTGGSGRDVFRFTSIAEIGLAAGDRDVITDFFISSDSGEHSNDFIDFDAIDALTTVAGTQHFDWLGAHAHTGAGATLRYEYVSGNTLVTGDVDADGIADFALEFTGIKALTGRSFTAATIARIVGTGADDLVLGSGMGREVLGLAGADTIVSGIGVDIMTGGAGADVFRWSPTSSLGNHTGTGVSTRDIITDFEQGIDKIDLSAFDANSSIAGKQDFNWLGTGFHTGAGGTLRYTQTGTTTVIWGDVNADGAADFSIGLNGVYTLSMADFIL